MKIIYKVEKIEISNDEYHLENQLNTLGSFGWELIQTLYNPDNNEYLFIFKKE